MNRTPPTDLLEPSLEEADDLAGFDHPWQPNSLAMALFFCGPIGGGYLVARNFDRLGMKGRFWPCLSVFVGIAVVWLVVVALSIGQQWFDSEDRDTKRAMRFGLNLLSVGVGLWFLRQQSHRFHIYSAGGREPASLWGPGLAALGVGLVVGFGIAFAATALAVLFR